MVNIQRNANDTRNRKHKLSFCVVNVDRLKIIHQLWVYVVAASACKRNISAAIHSQLPYFRMLAWNLYALYCTLPLVITVDRCICGPGLQEGAKVHA